MQAVARRMQAVAWRMQAVAWRACRLRRMHPAPRTLGLELTALS